MTEFKSLPEDYYFLIKSDHSHNCPSYTIRVCNCTLISGCKDLTRHCGKRYCFQFGVTLTEGTEQEKNIQKALVGIRVRAARLSVLGELFRVFRTRGWVCWRRSFEALCCQIFAADDSTAASSEVTDGSTSAATAFYPKGEE
eukprot:GHVP01062406.1.p1 GENE.GHVP01062406.1~~GHVP01062406.1.p1  ORF type:complete len:142 (+),score=17.20 GHVP01062406.1:817-1242(+)